MTLRFTQNPSVLDTAITTLLAQCTGSGSTKFTLFETVTSLVPPTSCGAAHRWPPLVRTCTLNYITPNFSNFAKSELELGKVVSVSLCHGLKKR